MINSPKPNDGNDSKPTKRKDIHKHLEKLRTRFAKVTNDLAQAEEEAASDEAARIDALGAADFVACVRAISPAVLDTIAIHIVGAAMDKRQQDSVQTWLDKVTAEARTIARSLRTSENGNALDDAVGGSGEADSQSTQTQVGNEEVKPPSPVDDVAKKADQEAAEPQSTPLPQATSLEVGSTSEDESREEDGASMSSGSD